jgi:hypothetical protein
MSRVIISDQEMSLLEKTKCTIIYRIRETQGLENTGDILVFGKMWLVLKMDVFSFVRGFVRCCYQFIETTLGFQICARGNVSVCFC